MTTQIEWLAGLTVLGFVLIGLEVFLPGAVLGIVGALCLMGAVGVSFSAFGMAGGFLALFILVVLCAIFTPLLIKYAPHTPFGRMLTLNASGRGQCAAPEAYAQFVGQSGTARSPLRPSGIAMIGGQRVDVVSESGHIAAGTTVLVTRVEGVRIVVEPQAAQKATT